jgi:hypothetical protein
LVTEVAPTPVSTPVETPATQAAPPVASQDAVNPGVTDDKAPVQSETPPEGTVETPAVDEGERLREAAIEARIAEARETGRTEGRDEVLTPRQAEAQRQRVADLHTSFDSTAKTIRQNLGNLLVQDSAGIIRGMSDAEMNQLVLGLVEKHHGKLLGSKFEDFNKPFEDGAVTVLPQAARADFIKKADGKEPNDYVREFGESYAPHSGYVKALDLEKVDDWGSTKFKAQLAKRDEASYKAGRDKGRSDPPGEPRTGDGVVTSEPTYAQLTQMKKAQLDALPAGMFERVMAKGR